MATLHPATFIGSFQSFFLTTRRFVVRASKTQSTVFKIETGTPRGVGLTSRFDPVCYFH